MKDLIKYSDFEKLDIRAGLVVAASAPEWSEKLIRYEVDLGEEFGKRILFSGIRKWYQPDDLIGKRIGIELINGSKYNGILKSFDVYMNVVLDDCEVNDVKGNITKHNVVFVRASYGILKLTF